MRLTVTPGIKQSVARTVNKYRVYGTGVTSHSLGDAGDVLVSGDLEVNGTTYIDGPLSFAENAVFGIGGVATTDNWIFANTTRTQVVMCAGATYNNSWVICTTPNFSKDFDHPLQTHPTLFVQSNKNPDTNNTEFATVAYNNLSCGADYGAYCSLKSITEEVTIGTGTGTGGVATSSNLAPADSLILAVAARCTDAPGGGATTYDIGITGAGNQDGLIDGATVGLGDTAVSVSGNDGTQLPIHNSSATTLTITTDGDVTGDDMKVRITVFYLEITAPQS